MDISLNSRTTETVETELVERCPLCGSDESTLLFLNRDRLYYLAGEYGTLKCSECSLVRLSPRPTVESIGIFYPDDYGAYSNPDSIDAVSKGDRFGLRNGIRNAVLSELGYKIPEPPAWQRVLAPLFSKFFFEKGTYGYGDKFPRFVEGGRALEIGCGNGFFLSYLKHHGWQVNGLDLSPHAAQQAKERFDIDVFLGQVEDAPFPDESFHFIRLSHVVEHFFDPVASMRKVFKLLKPGGIVYVEVPNADGIGAEISGKYWYGWDAPRHLFMFNSENIGKTLRMAGFRDVSVRSFLWDSFAWASNYEFEEKTGQRVTERPRVTPENTGLVTANRKKAIEEFRSRPLDGDIISCWATK